MYDNYSKEGDVPGHVKNTNLDSLEIIFKQMKESVCKIYGPKLNGTGFFCAIQNMKELNSIVCALMTNNHVLGEEDIKPNKIIKFSLNNERKQMEIAIDESRRTFTSRKYDVTIIEMKQNDGIQYKSFMEIDKDIYEDDFKERFRNKSIYLLHYPKGVEICKSEEVIKNIAKDNYTIIHCCDSINGSSGGPLINLKNNKVIGVHKGYHGELKINLGTILREPIEKFYEQQNNSNNSKINKDDNKNIEQKINVIDDNSNEIINDNNNDLNDIDEITIQYKVQNSDKIRLFCEKFVKNNKTTFFFKKKCKIIICGKEYDLCEYWKPNLKVGSLFEIKLKGIKNITNMSCMFCNCSSLSSLPDISKWDTKNVKDMSYMFCQCSSLSSLPDISKWDTKNVTNMSSMFSSCSSLSSLPDISNLNTSKVKNMSSMFCNCFSLSSLPDISKWDTKNVTDMCSMFHGCASLSSLPDISKWDTKNVKDMTFMFWGCKENLNIPSKFKED